MGQDSRPLGVWLCSSATHRNSWVLHPGKDSKREIGKSFPGRFGPLRAWKGGRDGVRQRGPEFCQPLSKRLGQGRSRWSSCPRALQSNWPTWVLQLKCVSRDKMPLLPMAQGEGRASSARIRLAMWSGDVRSPQRSCRLPRKSGQRRLSITSDSCLFVHRARHKRWSPLAGRQAGRQKCSPARQNALGSRPAGPGQQLELRLRPTLGQGGGESRLPATLCNTVVL